MLAMLVLQGLRGARETWGGHPFEWSHVRGFEGRPWILALAPPHLLSGSGFQTSEGWQGAHGQENACPSSVPLRGAGGTKPLPPRQVTRTRRPITADDTAGHRGP